MECRDPATHHRPRRRAVRGAGIPTALTAIALLVAACGGRSGSSGVANVTSTNTAHSSSSQLSRHDAASHGDGYAGAPAYAQCIRTHGIADFPDPDRSGNIDLKGLHPGPGSDLDPDDPRSQAAAKACEALRPTGFSPGSDSVSATARRRAQARALRFSRCMRSHGVPNFPDPDSDGGLSAHSIRSAGLGPASPQFRTALTACGHDQPGNLHVSGPAGSGS
jgi:hypothetical protein